MRFEPERDLLLSHHVFQRGGARVSFLLTFFVAKKYVGYDFEPQLAARTTSKKFMRIPIAAAYAIVTNDYCYIQSYSVIFVWFSAM